MIFKGWVKVVKVMTRNLLFSLRSRICGPISYLGDVLKCFRWISIQRSLLNTTSTKLQTKMLKSPINLHRPFLDFFRLKDIPLVPDVSYSCFH